MKANFTEESFYLGAHVAEIFYILIHETYERNIMDIFCSNILLLAECPNVKHIKQAEAGLINITTPPQGLSTSMMLQVRVAAV